MRSLVCYLAVLIGSWLSCSIHAVHADDQVGAAEVDFEREVAPLLLKRCVECHLKNEPSGGLDLTIGTSLASGGDSGAVINREHLHESLLLQRVMGDEMPPEKNGKAEPLPAAEKAVLERWVTSGAHWPEGRVLDPYERTSDKRGGRDWWSLQPLVRPAVPHLADADAATGVTDRAGIDDAGGNEIDAFLGASLRQHEMVAAPPASKPVQLRRLYYDLIGLPPTAAEIERFSNAAATNPDEYEQTVDRLLMRPQFGERWARYWLDVVRFAETNGYERDAVKPHAWRYRDWVVDALNNDMPYDRFITEQLAGDEVADRSESSVIATGFLRLGTWDDEPNDALEYQYERLEDMVHATATAFLGLTVKCARCHDHKFDPIPQTDYYRIAAAFWPGPVAHRDRQWNGGPTKAELGYEVLGWTDLSRDAPELQLLKKGNVHRPAGAVAAGSLTATAAMTREFEAAPPDVKTTQRRLQLAGWIADKENPLTARVLVNRLWLHLFGEGLVRSPDNFGFQGQRPTHPELLDWLAAEFVDGNWRIKRMIKLMVMSSAYRQSSLHPLAGEYETSDAANNLWWRANRRRLDAEALRDSILQVSGRLDLRTGGESFKEVISQEALEGLSMKGGAYEASPPSQTARRSLYMFVKRSLAVPLMTVFDCCDTTAPAGRRDVTIVAPQALTLLNNAMILSESRAIAKRVLAAETDDSSRARAAWRNVLGRNPTTKEFDATLAHAETATRAGKSAAEAWSAICHVLINTNEFIYVD